MDTRSLGFLGLGALVAIVLVTLVGVPPALWITAVLAGAVVGLAYAVLKARESGVHIASRMVAKTPEPAPVDPPSAAPAEPAPVSDIDVELVRPADETNGVTAVWLHRHGGRRVHRYETAAGWVVEQVSTKDPDNPRKRVIGEPLTFELEWEAIEAADDLAQGIRPTDGAHGHTPRPTLAAEAPA